MAWPPFNLDSLLASLSRRYQGPRPGWGQPGPISLPLLPSQPAGPKSHPAQGSLAPLPTTGPGCPWAPTREGGGGCGAFRSSVRRRCHHTLLRTASKAIKQQRKNDGGRGNEPRRKLTLTQGAARLSADREGRLDHKTKHLNSPLYNNYSALNASSPCPSWPRPALQGVPGGPAGGWASREKGQSQA